MPDLPRFFSKLHTLQKPHGFFFHVHDANADFSNDPVLKGRISEVSGRPLPEWIARFRPNRVWERVCRELNGTQGQDPHSKTNRDLLRAGHIQVPLSVPEIHRITDVQLHSRRGVSIEQMKQCLLKYELLSTRSYGFFGQLGSSLPPVLRQEERKLISNRAPNGLHVAGAWRLRA
jgi:hypothetical protein